MDYKINFIFNGLFLLLITLSIVGCEKNKQGGAEEDSNIQKITIIIESDVAGFYTGRGLYNAGNATVELYYGGSFIMEDPYLPDGGPAFGKWVLEGSSINFYMEGQKIFSASVSRSKNEILGIILNGQLWKKLR